MTGINVSIKHEVAVSTTPSSSSVAKYLRLTSEVGESTGAMSALVIDWYNDNWSMFIRSGSTDFDCKDWVKRNFKAPAQALEKAIKGIDNGFDGKLKHYKNVKTLLGKCAFAGLMLETMTDDQDIVVKSQAQLEKELKDIGTTRESTADMVIRGCEVICPVDRDGEPKLYIEDYASLSDDINDMAPVLRAVEALGHIIGFARLERIAGGFAESMLENTPQPMPDSSAAQIQADKQAILKDQREGNTVDAS